MPAPSTCGGKITWRDLGPFNHPAFSEVKGHTATLVGDKVLVLGGRDRAGTFQVLSMKTMQWTVLPDNAPRRRYHSANLVDDVLFIFHGFEANHHAVHVVAYYDPLLQEWTWLRNQGDFPSKRAYHTTNYVASRREIVLFGGSHNGTKYNDLYAFKVETRAWQKLSTKGRLPSRRRGHGAVEHRSKIFVFGGKASTGENLQDLFVLDFTRLSDRPLWSELKPSGTLPLPKRDASLMYHKGRLVLFGGSSRQEKSLFVYYPTRNEWVHVGSKDSNGDFIVNGEWPIESWRHRAVQFGGKILYLGGYKTRRFFDLEIHFHRR